MCPTTCYAARAESKKPSRWYQYWQLHSFAELDSGDIFMSTIGMIGTAPTWGYWGIMGSHINTHVASMVTFWKKNVQGSFTTALGSKRPSQYQRATTLNPATAAIALVIYPALSSNSIQPSRWRSSTQQRKAQEDEPPFPTVAAEAQVMN
jgi:hypothetical protein